MVLGKGVHSPIIFVLVMEPLTYKIRNNPLITDIQLHDSAHKISYVTDDVILMFTNPLPSYLEIQRTVLQFSEVSYYKLNASKSQLIGLHIPKPPKILILEQFPYQWSPSTIPFLGIQPTSSISRLVNCN